MPFLQRALGSVRISDCFSKWEREALARELKNSEKPARKRSEAQAQNPVQNIRPLPGRQLTDPERDVEGAVSSWEASFYPGAETRFLHCSSGRNGNLPPREPNASRKAVWPKS